VHVTSHIPNVDVIKSVRSRNTLNPHLQFAMGRRAHSKTKARQIYVEVSVPRPKRPEGDDSESEDNSDDDAIVIDAD